MFYLINISHIAGMIVILVAFSLCIMRARRSKKAAEKACRSLAFAQFSIDHAVDMAYWLNADEGRMFYANEATASRLGYSREELVGMTIPDIDPNFPKGEWSKFAEKLKTTGFLTFETHNITKSGEKFPVEVTARWMEFGNEDRFIAFGRDITERKEREENLIIAKNDSDEARAVAEKAIQAKSIFLANMSHELRSPLAAIIGYSHLLERKANLSSPLVKYVNNISSSGQHLSELINDVLESSKFEAGRIVLTPCPFDLSDLLEDVEAMVRGRANEKHLQLTVTQLENVPCSLVGDKIKLRQILINLLTNAIKFTDTGKISLEIDSRNNDRPELELVMTVEDTGSGISAEEIGTLFRPFEQTVGGRVKGGTGLGLAISKQYSQLMGGDLIVTSQPGQGSIFTCTCRVEKGTQSIPAVSEKTGNRLVIGLNAGEPQRTILIVDDQPDHRYYVKQLLEDIGFFTIEAKNGKEALATIAAQSIDLVLMDIKMPILDGYQATMRLKASRATSNIPIITISASVFGEQKKILAAGADGFLPKPLNETDLFEKIGRLLDIEYNYAELD